jgi:hypothetical protein
MMIRVCIEADLEVSPWEDEENEVVKLVGAMESKLGGYNGGFKVVGAKIVKDVNID